jgi:hypothetical protein
VPGVLHQGILRILRDDPWLAFDLLGIERPVDGTPMDRRGELDRDSKRPGHIDPVFPDVVLVYRDPENPRLGIVICGEAQLKADREKYKRVVLYLGLLVDEYDLRVEAAFVSFSRAFTASVATWAHRRPPVFALVLHCDNVPCMTLEQALQRPTAAVLAGALHGYRGNLDAARIAIVAIRDLPKRQRDNYTRTIMAALPKRLHTQLKKELPVRQRDELLEIEMQSGTYHLGLRAGRKEGLARGLERGRKAGLEQARRTLINLILTVLDARDVAVDRKSKARIRRAAFPTLERWASAVRDVTQVSELFDLEDTP